MGTLLHPELLTVLKTLRAHRGFSPSGYIQAKALLLNSYMKASGLKSVVVGVSGGVDSALVLAIVAHASKQPGSPIKRVVAALLPYFISEGTTNQDEATKRGREVAEAFGAECQLIDLSASHAAMKQTVDRAANIDGNAWAAGQLVSYLRTPALFYVTSLLTQEGFPAILVGTTNRDEGGYIGYFGKAADAMVDLQLISDIHKSEVYETSRILEVPASVLAADPTGDIYDGRNDEQLIGAPYDFIELHSLYLCAAEELKIKLICNLSPEARQQFDQLSNRLETLNKQNQHKYLAGSTAVHLDIYPRAVPGGWRTDIQHVPTSVDTSVFVNQLEINPSIIDEVSNSTEVSTLASLPGFAESAFLLHGLLSDNECKSLSSDLLSQEWVPVGQNGMRKDFDPAYQAVGSYRASFYSERFAKALWERIAPNFPQLRITDEFTPTDTDGQPVWRAVGVSPLMRFIRYTTDGLLVPHYDAPFDYHDGKRTLMSVVVYLSETSTDNGGATRFILDPQRHLPLAERDFSDWQEFASPKDVLFKINPQLGSALIFDHRLLHDSEPIYGNQGKLIMRTDIIFERCGLPGKTQLSVSKPLGLPETVATTLQPSELSWDSTSKQNQELLLKALKDPFYGSAYQTTKSLEGLLEAGYFDDGADANATNHTRAGNDWLMTPLSKISRRLELLANNSAGTGQKLTVLLTTGSFCPIHKGHIEMMDLAKQELERQGAIVLGGYLSPSHDEYVGSKCKSETLSAAHRVRLCQETVKDSDWLMVDPWEALGVERALNFTDVILHLESYLAKYVRSALPIQVVYVFGSDNARFAKTFLNRGSCICILRPGSEAEFDKYARDEDVLSNPKIIFAQGASLEISSQAVRNGSVALMDKDAEYLFQKWKHETIASSQFRKAHYYLRDEGEWTLAPWSEDANPELLTRAWLDFRHGLTTLFQYVHNTSVNFTILDLQDQQRRYAKLTAGQQVISLDACIEGNYNLGVSRHFQLATVGESPVFGTRPGFASLAEQIKSIPPGEYVLFDDDMDSGATMARCRELLPASVVIKYECVLTQKDERRIDNVLDILDCRDFLAGAREAGLVMTLHDGSLVRAPYVLPYVSPAERASVPISKELEFSLGLWQLNEQFFTRAGVTIRLADANPHFRHLMYQVGFIDLSPMVSICRWHVSYLEKLVSNQAQDIHSLLVA